MNDKQKKFDLADRSDIKRKFRNLMRRGYDFQDKHVVICAPIYQKGANNKYTKIYETDKLRYCANLIDVLYLKQQLYLMRKTKMIEITTFGEDIASVKKKLGEIDYLILSHKFTELDKEELKFELKEKLDGKDIKIIQLK